MKSHVADYKYRVYCVRIIPLWGDPVYITGYVRDLTMGDHIYKTDNGYEFTGLATEGNMAPGVMDLNGIADIAGLSYNEIVSGVFDNARLYLFATTWNNPIEDEEPIGVAFMGKTTIKDDRYTVELMQMIDALNQAAGKTYTVACPKKFGGQEYAGCMFDLSTVTVTGTLTHIVNNSYFSDSNRDEVADYFAEGTIAFTTGANAGLKPIEIKFYGLGGFISTYESFHYPVAVGDEYIMIPGCRKRPVEDCAEKWHNIINCGGFTHIPTNSQYIKIGGQE